MSLEGIVGVILAAGKGARMEPFSAHYPKPILPICNRPLLHYQIECMKRVGIEEIFIVIGHLGYEITRSLQDGGELGVCIRYVEQKETLGIAHAVGRLEPYITTPFLLFLGDIFFVADDLACMVDAMRHDSIGAVLAVKEEEDREAIKRNFAVILEDGNRVRRVIEKPRYTPNTLKGCGLYLFDLPIFDAIRRTPRTAMRDEYEITDSIQILIEDGVPVSVAPVVHWDINLTFPPDLLRCNLEQLRCLGLENVVGRNVRLPPGARLINAVLGENVVIEHPIQIKDSVIFPHTTVSLATDQERMILTPENIIDCRYY